MVQFVEFTEALVIVAHFDALRRTSSKFVHKSTYKCRYRDSRLMGIVRRDMTLIG